MTPMHEDEARTRLQGVTPGARPDTAAIIRTGRRRNRNAALAGATAAIVAIVGVSAGVALLWDRPHQDAVPAPLQTPSASASPSPIPTAAPGTTQPTGTPQPTASETTSPTRTWPTIRGEAGGPLTVDGQTVGRAQGPDQQTLPTKDFIALMGTPDETTSHAQCRNQQLANTVHRWGDLRVVVLDEEDTESPYGFAFAAGEVAGWTIDPTLDGKPGLSFPMTGPDGAQIGDDVPTLEQLFPTSEWDQSGVFDGSYSIFAGDTTGADFKLDADQKVASMTAGYSCR